MKVKRVMDTVTVEMDVDVAEKLCVILRAVEDESFSKALDGPKELMFALREDAEIRHPSPLYTIEGNLVIKDNPPDNYETEYVEENGSLHRCGECGGTTGRHYLSCSTWLFNRISDSNKLS